MFENPDVSGLLSLHQWKISNQVTAQNLLHLSKTSWLKITVGNLSKNVGTIIAEIT